MFAKSFGGADVYARKLARRINTKHDLKRVVVGSSAAYRVFLKGAFSPLAFLPLLFDPAALTTTHTRLRWCARVLVRHAVRAASPHSGDETT